MRKSSWAPIIVISIVIILAFVIGRLVYYGLGAKAAYTPPDRPLSDVPVEVAARSERLEAVDNPAVSRGVVVIDYAHDNALFVEELNILLSKIVTRGFSYEVVFAEETEPKPGEGKSITEKLRYAEALILPLPRKEYTPQEIIEFERFVERGGRLLIIGDPTRTIVVEALNSIAGSFGIIYANDYLYSLDQNDNNYRNVIFTDFKESPVTAGLGENSRVIFYAGSSVNAPGHEIILGNETIFSSTSEGGRATAAAALTTNDQVLAIGDLTFFGEPYSAAENNGTLINNIADFLTQGQPEFKIVDFPFFFNSHIDIVFDDPRVFNSQFEDSVKLKEILEEAERTVNFADEIGDENDVIFIGRYNRAEAVEDYLAAANITILEPDQKSEVGALVEEAEGSNRIAAVSDVPVDDKERFIDGRIQIEGMGDLERGGSTLFYRHQDGERNILIILSDNVDTNADAFDILLKNQLAECQADAQIAVCQTEDPNEQLPPSLRSNRIDKILVVSDDDGRERADAQTSILAYSSALSATYKVDTWITSKDGSPALDQLLEYDAIIWTTGTYWDDSIGEQDVELLAEYKRVGGNLVLDGASIAFDWDHTDFLSDVAHADYLGFAEQKDLEVALPDHPIATDFEESTIITFTETTTSTAIVSPSSSEEELPIDVVRQTPDARVIFKRGPDSKDKGAPSLIAYEDDRVKIAFFAFPVYLLSEDARALLINNTVDWFTKKVLDPPDAKDYEPFEGDDSTKQDEVQDESAGESTGEGQEGENSGGEDQGDSGDQGGNNQEDSGDQGNSDGETSGEDNSQGQN